MVSDVCSSLSFLQPEVWLQSRWMSTMNRHGGSRWFRPFRTSPCHTLTDTDHEQRNKTSPKHYCRRFVMFVPASAASSLRHRSRAVEKVPGPAWCLTVVSPLPDLALAYFDRHRPRTTDPKIVPTLLPKVCDVCSRLSFLQPEVWLQSR